MKPIWRLLQWLLKAAVFFTLFAFAVNNQHAVVAHFFFGRHWSAPLVVIVLIAFTAGLVAGVLGMLPRWRHARISAGQTTQRGPADAQPYTGTTPTL